MPHGTRRHSLRDRLSRPEHIVLIEARRRHSQLRMCSEYPASSERPSLHLDPFSGMAPHQPSYLRRVSDEHTANRPSYPIFPHHSSALPTPAGTSYPLGDFPV